MVSTQSQERFSYVTSETVANGDEWVVNLDDGQTGPVVISQIAHGGDCNVDLVTSSESGSLVEEKRIALDTLSGEGVSMGNELEANNQQDLYVAIENTSGGEADFIVAGEQLRA
jgi:hypothetical protein